MITKILMWITSNSRMLLLAGAALSVISLGLYMKGRLDGYDKAIRETNAERLKTINDNLKIKQGADIIMRPDDITLIKRLRDGTI